MKKNLTKSGKRILDLSYTALGAALIAVCAFITIPLIVPFTMQTFAIFAVSAILGFKRGVCAVLVYIAAGVLGAPIFAGFRAGPAVLVGTTGGYISGFILIAVIVGLCADKWGTKLYVSLIAMTAGLILCYAFGTIWFVEVYTRNTGEMGYAAALSTCVVPFIIPDICKMIVAALIAPRLRKIISKH